MIRLQKFIAGAGICSRRAAEKLIRAGRVTVDGRQVTEMGMRVDPSRNTICVDGKRIAGDNSPYRYIMLNKPAGVLTTVHDPFGRPTVMDILGRNTDRIYPVGRLDKDSEGLILLTNDGALAHRLLHPGHKVPKTYVATVTGHPSEKDLDILRAGVDINGKTTLPCRIRPLGRTRRSSVLRIVLKEGKKRQIRLMFRQIGHPVIRLKRIRIGPLHLDRLPAGESRLLSNREIGALKKAVGL